MCKCLKTAGIWIYLRPAKVLKSHHSPTSENHVLFWISAKLSKTCRPYESTVCKGDHRGIWVMTGLRMLCYSKMSWCFSALRVEVIIQSSSLLWVLGNIFWPKLHMPEWELNLWSRMGTWKETGNFCILSRHELGELSHLMSDICVTYWYIGDVCMHTCVGGTRTSVWKGEN